MTREWIQVSAAALLVAAQAVSAASAPNDNVNTITIENLKKLNAERSPDGGKSDPCVGRSIPTDFGTA